MLISSANLQLLNLKTFLHNRKNVQKKKKDWPYLLKYDRISKVTGLQHWITYKI